MQTLEPLNVSNSDKLALSRLDGDFTNDFMRRFVFSTAGTRDIVNKSELLGVNYTQALEDGMTELFTGYKEYWPFELSEEHANVLHFLRGGLNFGIREALNRAYGWNEHSCTYISSQRDRDEQGRWFIREDSYRKSTMKPNSIVFCGDVLATGVTLEHGLHTLTKLMTESGASIRYVVFVTIGCHKAEKVLETMATHWRQVFPSFQGIDLFYVEGKFHLANSKTPVQIKLPGTDLLRRDSVLMPEFIADQENSITAALERCTIYDAGSRAFDTEEYKDDVRDYWQQVQTLANNGVTTLQYLEERYPEAGDLLRSAAQEQPLTDICKHQLSLLQ